MSPALGISGTPLEVHVRVRHQLCVQLLKLPIGGDRDLAANATDEVAAPLVEVDGLRREPLGMKSDAERVRGRLEQLRSYPFRQNGDGAVGRDEVAEPVEYDRRIRLVRGEKALERLANRRHLLAVEAALAVRGRIARGEEQPVPLAQRDVEPLGEVEHHLPAWARPARLDEAEVPR